MNFRNVLLIAALVAAPVAGMLLHGWLNTPRTSTSGSAAGPAVEARTIEWPKLAEYDLKNGKPSESLMELDGRMIRLPGFMVPLEDNMKQVREFLLVPDPQACIHYPPPPPNQQVLVQMVGEESASVEWKPIWIEGHLRIATGTTKYGEAIFQVKARHTETYKAGF